MSRKKKPRVIAVIDFETDPFKHGREVTPFAAGFYDGVSYHQIWGDDCVVRLMTYIDAIETPLTIYAHNGGKFDFHFLLKYLAGRAIIVNGRILKIKTKVHEYRDSYGIIPIPLKGYKKQDIDYRKMEKDCREKHKIEILDYLKSDCVYLHELVLAFNNMFGNKLTIGSTALSELEKRHPFDHISATYDELLRPYYMGGRVQCFESGMVAGDLKLYDVNSMYPSVMRDFTHPIGSTWNNTDEPETADFITLECTAKGCFPLQTKDGLTFPHDRAVFNVTGHEYRAAARLGLFTRAKILDCWECTKHGDFAHFVNEFYSLRLTAKANGDALSVLFYKLIMNSAYGKTGQNPENFADYKLTGDSKDDLSEILELQGSGWESKEMGSGWIIWERPSVVQNYFNVGIAASITGAARSILMRAIHTAKRPVYCDTDSILCEELRVDLDDDRLGAWKHECDASRALILGKKMYTLYDGFKHVKSATKGVRLTPLELLQIHTKGTMLINQDAPTFKFGKQTFISRTIRGTDNARNNAQ